MQPLKSKFFFAAAIGLITILLISPAFAQTFQVTYPNGGSLRWFFDYPKIVDPGQTFTVTAGTEHVSGGAPVQPVLRVNAQPTPYVLPVSSGECDPNNCSSFGTMDQSDQKMAHLSFQVSSTASNGMILTLKVDTTTSDAPNSWINIQDLQVQVRPAVPIVVTSTQVVATVTPTQPTVDPAVLYSGIIAGIVVIGIVAVYMVTRRKPPSAQFPYKPYQQPFQQPYSGALKPAAGATKPVTGHSPTLIGTRKDEKK